MTKFGHIGIPVVDLDESLEFYTTVLGCTLIKIYEYPEMRLAFIDANGSIIELIWKKANIKSEFDGAINHLAFKVDSLEEKIELLEQRGIETEGPPREVGNAMITFFRGPNNERFEFVARRQA